MNFITLEIYPNFFIMFPNNGANPVNKIVIRGRLKKQIKQIRNIFKRSKECRRELLKVKGEEI